jgi:hypothetical protein
MTSSDSLTDKLNITPPKFKCNSVALLPGPHVGDPSLLPSCVSHQAVLKAANSDVALDRTIPTGLTSSSYLSYNSISYGRGAQN